MDWYNGTKGLGNIVTDFHKRITLKQTHPHIKDGLETTHYKRETK